MGQGAQRFAWAEIVLWSGIEERRIGWVGEVRWKEVGCEEVR